jgi:GAF domain-containing protein
MSEGLILAPVERGTLLAEPARLERLDGALPQIHAAVDGEDDAVALEATLACLLWETFAQASWCGFYRRVGDRMLAIGPYQGTFGCIRIEFGRGVCGACARSGEIQIVPDVSKVDHIACDPRTRSEIVVPVFDHTKRLQAVLDIDSNELDAFSRSEGERLEKLVQKIFGRPEIRF